jgi:SAM-dependent methyltransferase
MPVTTQANWHDDDSLWIELLPVLFGPDTLAKAPGEVDHLLALIAPHLPGHSLRILDLPCGVGRHSIELASRGHHVVGVDRTTAYIDVARAAAAERAPRTTSFHVGDMRRFRDAESRPFDLVLNLWTSFGYFDDEADDAVAARNFLSNLRPGGLFVIELISKEVLARIFRARTWDPLPDGGMRVEEHRLIGAWERIDNTWTFLRDGRVSREVRFSHRLFSAVELRDLLKSVGFEIVGIHGSLAGTPFDHAANRLAILARRPA